MKEVIDCDFLDLLSGLYHNSDASMKTVSQMIRRSPKGTVEKVEKELDVLILEGNSKKITSFNDYLTFVKNILNHRYESEEIEFEEELL